MPSLALSSCPWPNSRWRQYLQAGSHDVNLADYNLGSWTGIDAFDLLQEEGCDIPFILLTAALGLNFSSGHLLTADPRGVSAFGIWPAIPFSRAQRKVRSVAKRKSLRNRGALRGLTAPYACFRSRGSLGTYSVSSVQELGRRNLRPRRARSTCQTAEFPRNRCASWRWQFRQYEPADKFLNRGLREL